MNEQNNHNHQSRHSPDVGRDTQSHNDMMRPFISGKKEQDHFTGQEDSTYQAQADGDSDDRKIAGGAPESETEASNSGNGNEPDEHKEGTESDDSVKSDEEASDHDEGADNAPVGMAAEDDKDFDQPTDNGRSDSEPSQSDKVEKQPEDRTEYSEEQQDDEETRIFASPLPHKDEQTGDEGQGPENAENTEADQSKPREPERKRKERRRQKRGRIRLIPIWFRIVLILAAVTASAAVGAMIGYGIIGEGGSMMDVFDMETWYYIYDLIFDGTELERER